MRSSKTIAIHQPNYLPHLGYFEKMARSDIFVILDSVQYEKDSYTNRTLIKTPKGQEWLTLSIQNNFPQPIKDVKLANFRGDSVRHLKTIEMNYKKAKGFKTVFPIIQKLYEGNWQYLSQFNIHLIRNLAGILKKEPKIERTSKYNFKKSSTELLIEICKKFGADTYLAGGGGKKYQDDELFKGSGIKLEYLDYVQPESPQLWGKFIKGLSIIDYLFNQNYGV